MNTFNKSNLSLSLIFLSSLLLFSSCVTVNTPQTRIEKNPQIFEKLSPKEQVLVKEKKIKEGMSKDAVFLSLGKADKIEESFANGKKQTVWYYTRTQPVYHTSVSGGIVFGSRYYNQPYYNSGYYHSRYNSYRKHRHNYFYPRIGTGVYYKKVADTEVTFTNDRVSAWKISR